MNRDFTQQIRSARSAMTPIIAIETADNFATLNRVAAALSSATPMIQHDLVRGWTPVVTVADGALVENRAGVEAMADIKLSGKSQRNPVKTLEDALSLPGRQQDPYKPGSILFMHNAHEYLAKDIEFVQALLNLRDEFKRTMRTIILLGPSFSLPASLFQHVEVIDDPLPTSEELAAVVDSFKQFNLDGEAKAKAVSAIQGLAAFPAEQALASSAAKGADGTVEVNFDQLWARKRKMVSDTPGLEFWGGKETFSDVVDYEEAVAFLKSVNRGRRPPSAIVLLDEGEQQAGGSRTDSSGVSQKMMGKLLSEMQDKKYRGQIHYGIPGCGKTLLAKAMAGDAGVPLIIFNLAEVENSLVGESQARLVMALKAIDAVSNNNPYFIMTSNDLSGIPSQLKARFAYGGVWMFDMPSRDGVTELFKFYLKRYDLESLIPEIQQLDLEGWVPRDVEWCVAKAYDLNLSLTEAASRVVSYGKANQADVRAIQVQADGRYLNASAVGPYKLQSPKTAPITVSTDRTIESNV